jgi:beta-lactamase class A
MNISRRHILTLVAGLVARPTLSARARVQTLQALESRAGGRLGVCILNTATGHQVGNRMDERFAMCSTFKLPLAAMLLREADLGRLRLTDIIRFSQKDMVPHAPVTGPNLEKGGMTVAALAEAAQVTSDNVAANLLLRQVGGPVGFTAILRSIGDRTTRLDRFEPALNLVLPGEVHDTTTPRAMAETISKVVAGDLLTNASRERLIAWMVATRTGDKRIRAGLPKDWRAGDKTGTANADTMTDKVNDIAAAWPPGKAPIVVAAYYDSDKRSMDIRDEDQAVLAETGRIAAAWITG